MHTSNAIARALDMKRDPPSVCGVKRTVDLNIVRRRGHRSMESTWAVPEASQ